MIQPDEQHRYLQIAGDVRARIQAGELPVGSLLPSQTALCAQYRVARDTIRQALQSLERQGLITMPAKARSRVIRLGPPALGGPEEIAAPDDVAELLDLTPGAAVTRRRELLYESGRPEILKVIYRRARVA